VSRQPSSRQAAVALASWKFPQLHLHARAWAGQQADVSAAG